MARGKRSNGEGSVYQRKDGMWIGAAYVLTTTGHRKRVTVSATSEEEAWKKLRKKIADSDAGIPVSADNWTIEGYLKYWLDNVVSTKRPRTVEGYGAVVRRHLVPGLGAKKLQRLSAQDVRTFLTRLRHDCRCCADKIDAKRPKDARRCCAVGECCGQVLSDRTVQQIHAVLRNALQHAMREEVIPRNVAKLVQVKSPRYDVHRGLDADQARKLLKEAESDRLKALYVLALYLGMRRGELLGLRWTDIDWDGWDEPCGPHADEFCEECADRYFPSLQVRQTLQRVGTKLVFVPPKTDRSERSTPLPPLVAEALIEHWDRQDDEAEAADAWEDSGLVFTTPQGGPIDPTYLRASWYPLRKRAGLDGVRFHDLRHSCVTLLLRLGVPPHIVRDIVGHSAIDVTMTIYASVSLQDKREALKKLTAELG
ncbi:tyrosine-type recombinase/integrase [Saccharothrix deserti]|uniref:tyrosine-type recombinase/integrase n=1 Tax=Saccharothrix deserti TaxID=2593674 RepID=UPI00131DB8AC|nr:tyrosine-type recombinase/integrase [Saccharothrix deserti]